MANRSGNHALARALIQGALTRYTDEPRQDHEGDAQLIVLGAILEEVGARRNGGWSERAKANVVPLGSGGGLIGLLWLFLERFG